VVNDDETEGDMTFEVKRDNGQVIVTYSNYFQPWIDEMLADKVLKALCKGFTKKVGDNTTEMKIMPQKKASRRIAKFFMSVREEVFYEELEEELEDAVAEGTEAHAKRIQEMNSIYGDEIDDWGYHNAHAFYGY